MPPERSGPGALAGAAEVGISCHRQHPDITFSDVRPRFIDRLRWPQQIDRPSRTPLPSFDLIDALLRRRAPIGITGFLGFSVGIATFLIRLRVLNVRDEWRARRTQRQECAAIARIARRWRAERERRGRLVPALKQLLVEKTPDGGRRPVGERQARLHKVVSDGILEGVGRYRLQQLQDGNWV